MTTEIAENTNAAPVANDATTPATENTTQAAPAGDAQPSIADAFKPTDAAASAPAAPEVKPDAAAPEAPKPIEYTDFKLPDTHKVPESVIEELKEFGKANNLPQEKVQQLLDARIETETRLLADLAKAEEEAYNTQQKAWETELNNDPELGGKNLAQTVTRIQSFVNRVYPDKKDADAVLKSINESGLGVQKQFVKLLVEAAKPFENGSIEGSVAGEKSTKTLAQAAQAQYPHLNP